MNEKMGTTTSALTGLAGTEQVKHTPGPWHASRKYRYVSTLNHSVIADVIQRPQRMANALLLAAAPDMLAALHHAVDAIEYACPTFEAMGEGGKLTIDILRAAIAKAEGRTP